MKTIVDIKFNLVYTNGMIIERELYPRIKPFIDSDEAIIITGMRRVGKTTLLKYIFEQIKSENKIFLDLENPLNQKYWEEKNYEKILDNLLVLGLNIKEKAYVFLDEIQFVKNIPSAVKYLIDHHKIKFFLTGSASYYLKNLFTESLAGRKFIFELFPLSFREFIQLKNIKVVFPGPSQEISAATFNFLNRYYEEYLTYGGFPGVVSKELIKEKKLMLEDIFSSYYMLEVGQLSDFRKTNIIRDLILLLMERAGSKLDVQRLSKELGVSRITIHEYISFLENTYFIKLIRPFSQNRDFEIRSTPKVYLCDSGMLNHFSRVSKGSLWENNIFCLLRTKGEINYYQRKNGGEIDFIVNKKYAYEVKSMPAKQDLQKLKILVHELKIKNYHIISKEYSDLAQIIFGFML